MRLCLFLDAFDLQDVALGFRFGSGAEVFSDAFSVQPAGNAMNDLPGGIREC